MTEAPDPCGAVFVALATALKASGLEPGGEDSDRGLTEEERLVLAYLRQRVRGRDLEAKNKRAATEAALPPTQSAPMPEAAPPMPEPSQPDGLQEGEAAPCPEGEALEPSEKEEEGVPKGISGIPKVGRTPPAPPERVSLPNARAKTPYRARIEGYSNLHMRADGGSGLVLGDDGEVWADDIPAGEYKLELGGVKGGRAVSVLVRLSVIPRPQDLWTSIPSDQNAPHAKPDEDFCRVEGEAFMVAASKRGRSHAKDGTFRDDHFGLSYDQDTGWHVMVVADGAGSASLSREGSRIACGVVLNALKEALPSVVDPAANNMVRAVLEASCEEERRSEAVLRPVVNSLVRSAYFAAQKLEERAQEIACRVADLSTTLSIAAAKRVDGKWLLISFSIGDGGVGVWDATTGKLSLMCQPDSGEYAGQTRFLALDEFAEGRGRASRAFVDVRDDFTAFLAMTDGITDPKFESDAALADPEKWRALWDDDLTKEVTFARDNGALEEEFLGWMDFWSRGNHDDRTLAVMVTKDHGPAGHMQGEGA